MDDSKVGKLDQMVRPLVTLGMLMIFGWLSIAGKISSDAALGLIGMVFGFWFQSRTDQKNVSSTTRTTETDPSGATREVVMTAPPGAPAPAPVAGTAAEPRKDGTV